MLCLPEAGAAESSAAVEFGLRFKSAAAAKQLLTTCAALLAQPAQHGQPPPAAGETHVPGAKTPAGASRVPSAPPSCGLSPSRPPHASPTRGATAANGRERGHGEAAHAAAHAAVESDAAAAATEEALTRAEHEIRQLRGLLAERDADVKRLLRRVEVAEAQALAREARVTELSRRLLLQEGEPARTAAAAAAAV